MPNDSKKSLKYLLSNGYENTIVLNSNKAFELLKWYEDLDSCNYYDFNEEIGGQATLFKDTILCVNISNW